MEFAGTAPRGADNSYLGGRGAEIPMTPSGMLDGVSFSGEMEEAVRLLTQIGLVSLGSALGGLARWGVSLGMGRLFDTAFPWGTFVINMTGSLFLGWFSAVLADRFVAREGGWLQADDLRLLVAVGFT